MLICDSESTKVCTGCGEEKPLVEFYIKSARKDGRQAECIDCAKARQTKYRKENRDKINNTRKKWLENNPNKRKESALKYWLKRTYGMTLIEYDELLKKQGGVCKICSSICGSHGRLSVDHDHKTGKIRGLLCSKCNMALGLLQDSPTLLQKAKEYLEE